MELLQNPQICVLLAIAFFAFLLVVFFALIHLYAYGAIYFATMKLRQKLKRQSRTLSLKEAKARIKAGDGMIIVDNPSCGWNVRRIWWSPAAEFLVKEPASKDKMCTQADRANYAKFIHPETGIAKLVDVFVFTQRSLVYLRTHFGLETCRFVPTGSMEFEDLLKRSDNNTDKQAQ